jgi:hypothetical protein
VFGVALGWYAGFTLLVPLGLSFLAGWILSRTLPARKVFVPPASLICGHVAWMMLGMVLVQRWEVGLDIVVLGGGLIWLLCRPGLGATLFLGICQVLELINSGYLLTVTSRETVEFKALVVHLVFYGGSLALLISAYLTYRRARNQTTDPVPPPLPGDQPNTPDP